MSSLRYWWQTWLWRYGLWRLRLRSPALASLFLWNVRAQTMILVQARLVESMAGVIRDCTENTAKTLALIPPPAEPAPGRFIVERVAYGRKKSDHVCF